MRLIYIIGFLSVMSSSSASYEKVDIDDLWQEQADILTEISANPTHYDQEELKYLEASVDHLFEHTCHQLAHDGQQGLIFESVSQSIGHVFVSLENLFTTLLDTYNLPHTTLHQCFVKCAFVDAIRQSKKSFFGLATNNTYDSCTIIQRLHEHLAYAVPPDRQPIHANRYFKKRYLLILLLCVGVTISIHYVYQKYKQLSNNYQRVFQLCKTLSMLHNRANAQQAEATAKLTVRLNAAEAIAKRTTAIPVAPQKITETHKETKSTLRVLAEAAASTAAQLGCTIFDVRNTMKTTSDCLASMGRDYQRQEAIRPRSLTPAVNRSVAISMPIPYFLTTNRVG